MTPSHTNQQNPLEETKLCRSFKPGKNFLFVILIDLVYYAILAASVTVFLRNAVPEMTVMQLSKDLVGLLTNETRSLYQHDLEIIRAARINFIGYSIALVIVLLVNFSCLKLRIWHLIAKKKYGITSLLKGLAVNFIFFVGVSLLGAAGYYLFNRQVFFIYLLFLIPALIYFLNWIHLSFAQTGSIRAIRQGISLGVRRFLPVLFPNALLLVLLILMIFIFYLITGLKPGIYWPLFLICFTFFLNWGKHLLYLYKKPFFD